MKVNRGTVPPQPGCVAGVSSAMKLLTTLFFHLIVFIGILSAQDTPEKIDWPKAQQLYQREKAGQTLTPDEQAYLDRAKVIRQKGGQSRPGAGNSAQRKAPERLIPLTDLGAGDRYEGQEGGLYGGGKNTPPAELQKLAETEVGKIQPLDAAGNPSPEGKIVFISISMSNATQEFSYFKQIADQNPAKSGKVTIVDCAQGGQAMAEWVSEEAPTWKVAMERIEKSGVTPAQVQAAWVKLANKSPSGSLEEHGKKLESDTLQVLHHAKAKFPHLQIAYLGSRIWAGNAKSGLNPEPYAYESAFPVRWLIERQAKGDAALSLETTPLLLWGPYLWAEGERGRKTDSLVWAPADFAGDGVHPSQSGKAKVAGMLLDYFTTDPLAAPWFAAKK